MGVETEPGGAASWLAWVRTYALKARERGEAEV
jgi:hypothetical protein